MEKFKEIIYNRYISLHNKHISGNQNISDYEKKFKSYNFYFRRFLPYSKTIKILDIGCGNGNFLFWLQSNYFYNSNGIDFSPEQIAEGKANGVLNLEICDISSFLVKCEEKYDIIFARDVFEHFTRNELFETFTLIKQVLNTNGSLIIQVPNGEGINMHKIFYGDITHELAFTESSLRQIALACGYNSVRAYPVPPHPHGFLSFIRSILWSYKNTKIKFWNYVEQGNASGIYTSNIIVEIK